MIFVNHLRYSLIILSLDVILSEMQCFIASLQSSFLVQIKILPLLQIFIQASTWQTFRWIRVLFWINQEWVMDLLAKSMRTSSIILLSIRLICQKNIKHSILNSYSTKILIQHCNSLFMTKMLLQLCQLRTEKWHILRKRLMETLHIHAIKRLSFLSTGLTLYLILKASFMTSLSQRVIY